LELRVDHVNGDELHELGEALVEPQVVPPLHGDQVPKPLDTPSREQVSNRLAL